MGINTFYPLTKHLLRLHATFTSLADFLNTAKYKYPYRYNTMTEKDNSTKLTWLTWHNIPYILQKDLKDPSSL